jgi:hypothetical protein
VTRLRALSAALLALAASAPLMAADEPLCALCSAARSAERPLSITIESGLQFSRLALTGQADSGAAIDPATGEKMVDPGMIDLGGLSFQGRARISGEPLRPVRIQLPSRVSLRSPDGSTAELTDFVTDLPAVTLLDQDGELQFAFGARLNSQGARGGNFRGRIPIRVDYY